MAAIESMPCETRGTNLADLLERILDKGIVITGDIKVKLVDVELLSIQLRLLICSVDKAREIGVAWWETDRHDGRKQEELLTRMAERLDRLEGVATDPAAVVSARQLENRASVLEVER